MPPSPTLTRIHPLIPVCMSPGFSPPHPPPLAGTKLVNAHNKDSIPETDVAIFVSPEFSINYYRWAGREGGWGAILQVGGGGGGRSPGGGGVHLWKYRGYSAQPQYLA